MIKGQWHTILLGMLFGTIWMVAQAVMPAIIGLAIDEGIAAKDTGALVKWASVMLGIGIVQSAAGIVRHRSR